MMAPELTWKRRLSARCKQFESVCRLLRCTSPLLHKAELVLPTFIKDNKRSAWIVHVSVFDRDILTLLEATLP